MITFKKLGKKGKLGNQMFQFAFLYNTGKKTGCRIGFDFKNNADITKIFKLPAENSDEFVPNYKAIEMNNFGYFDNSKIPDGTDFDGYFQNSKYIDEYEIDLRNIFIFNEETHIKCFNFIKKLKEDNNKELIAMHVRRTDYLIHKDMYYVCDENYYKKAIESFGKDYFYVIFTDDKKWCAETFKQLPNIIMNNNSELDLILMSLCDHAIISNSTYSWWGSWLNENLNKKIIAPNRWFNKTGPQNWHEIYRKDMVLI